MTAIRCENLSKFYKKGKVKALHNLNLQVADHTVFGFLGPNGAGKTTTIKILTGLMPQSSGQAWVAGEKLENNSMSLRKKIGYLSQEPRLYTWMTAIELLDFTGRIYGMSTKERSFRMEELIELSDLKHAAKRRISTYSGGMVQRLGIAQALMSKPEVIFLDEPTSSLDPIGRKEVLDMIKNLATDSTIFLSTHILEDVERVCDTVAILNHGELLIVEKTELLKKKYSSDILELEMLTNEEASKLTNICSHNEHCCFLKNEENLLHFESSINSEAKALILKEIIENGLTLVRLETKKASLEDVFIKIIGKS